MKKKIRCMVFIEQRVVELQRFPISEVDDDELLAKIEVCGTCTWEQHVFTGGINTDYPLIGGHEVTGRTEAIGRDVHSDWEVGQRVIVGATLPCRPCYFCETHEKQDYQNFNTARVLSGQSHPGTGRLGEYMMAVPYSVLPYTNVAPQEVCIYEPVSCIIHSVEAVNLQFGDACVVIGAGIIGLLHTQLCIEKGCFVIVVDMDEERLEMAAPMGVHYTTNPHKEHAKRRIVKIARGRKTRVVFDTTLVASVVGEACRYVDNMGKLMTYSGIYSNKPAQMDAHWIHKGSIQILGVANSNDRDSMRAACMISEGITNAKPFISGVCPVEEVPSALASSYQGNTFRNIITFSKEL